jgi:hypothetical protein
MTLAAGDNVSNSINLSNGATLNSLIDLELASVNLRTLSIFTFSQDSGETSGLSMNNLFIDGTSKLDIQFDLAQVAGLDWGLRLSGDKTANLQAFLDNDLVNFSGGTEPIGIIYDVTNYGNYTYLGYVSAIPLPASFPLMLFSLAAMGIFTRKRSLKK